MPVVPVRHATGQYDVHIEAGILLSLPELLTAALGRRKLVLITDDIVGRYYDEWTRGTAEARALGPLPAPHPPTPPLPVRHRFGRRTR